jgi:hypothetical protein
MSYVGGLRGAFLSLSGLHEVCGYEYGSQSAIPNQGATDSSNQWVTSLPGLATVGGAAGSNGRVSIQVTSFAEPGTSERKRVLGSSWPM